MKREKGFTLVETLVVLAIAALLVTLLVPTLSNARAIARISLCAANMRQAGVMMSAYASDCKGALPMPTTTDRLLRANNNSGSYRYIYPNNIIDIYTQDGVSCPLNVGGAGAGHGANTQAVGYGWYYYLGYVPPYAKVGSSLKNKERNPVGIFDCPGTPNYCFKDGTTTVPTYGQTPLEYVEDWVSQYSKITNLLADRDTYSTNNNPGNVNTGGTHCFPQFYQGIGYINRGWSLNSVSTPTEKLDSWNPGNGWAIDDEEWLPGPGPNSTIYDLGYPRKHANGLNVQKIDGSVVYRVTDMPINVGGVNRTIPYAIWVAVTYGANGTGTTLDLAYANTTSGMYSAPTGSNRFHNKLWAFYEGNPDKVY